MQFEYFNLIFSHFFDNFDFAVIQLILFTIADVITAIFSKFSIIFITVLFILIKKGLKNVQVVASTYLKIFKFLTIKLAKKM